MGLYLDGWHSMFDLFKSDPHTDPELGMFTRSGGKWRGSITLPGIGETPVALSGSRKQPDASSLNLARLLPTQYGSLLPDIQKGLFEHYEPYLQAHEDGDYRAAEPFPKLSNDPSLWERVRLVGVTINADEIEVAYETDWDEEHTIGARIRNGKLIEMNGSILADF